MPAKPKVALVDYVDAQIDQIARGDADLRRGLDPIHDTRVAIRRLRSTLRVFGKVLDRRSIEGMDAELKWFAGLLGEVRDCQVQLARFGDAVDELPGELVLGPVKARIRNHLKAIELPARAEVDEAMKSQRYVALSETLRNWRAEAPVSRSVSAKALRKRTRGAGRKADRRLASALENGTDDMLHRARKAAKRARYAAELYQPVEKRVKRKVKHYKHIQSVLGDHQDTAVATEVLRRIAVAAGTTPGENGFTYGLLYAREQQIAARCRKAMRRL